MNNKKYAALTVLAATLVFVGFYWFTTGTNIIQAIVIALVMAFTLVYGRVNTKWGLDLAVIAMWAIVGWVLIQIAKISVGAFSWQVLALVIAFGFVVNGALKNKSIIAKILMFLVLQIIITIILSFNGVITLAVVDLIGLVFVWLWGINTFFNSPGLVALATKITTGK